MPRNKHPEETRAKILEAALKTFQEKGYEQSTILDIVENMGGLTRGAFYHHFKSKEEVLDAISDKFFYENHPFAQMKYEKGLNGLEKLRKAMFWSFSAHENSGMSDLQIASVHVDLKKNPQLVVGQIEFNNMLVKEYIMPLMEEGRADGSITLENPQLVAELIFLITNFWILPTLYPGDIDYVWSKIKLVKTICDNLGFPIFDDESMEYAERSFRKLFA